MTSGYKSQQELEYEREKKKRETENRPVPTEWKVQQLEKNLNANYDEYMAHVFFETLLVRACGRLDQFCPT